MLADCVANFSACSAFRGTFVHTPHFGNVEYLKDHVCVVSSKEQGGKILALLPAAASQPTLAEHGILGSTVYTIPVSVCELARSVLSKQKASHGACTYQVCCLTCPWGVCGCRRGVSCAQDL